MCHARLTNELVLYTRNSNADTFQWLNSTITVNSENKAFMSYNIHQTLSLCKIAPLVSSYHVQNTDHSIIPYTEHWSFHHTMYRTLIIPSYNEQKTDHSIIPCTEQWSFHHTMYRPLIIPSYNEQNTDHSIIPYTEHWLFHHTMYRTLIIPSYNV